MLLGETNQFPGQTALAASIVTPVDVYLQDQTSPPIDYYLTNKIQDVTLAAPVAKESHYIGLAAGHGFTVTPAMFIEIKYISPTLIRHYQGRVIAVNTNQITVMPSLDFDVDPQYIVSAKRVRAGMSQVAGSLIAPIDFDLSPVDGLRYDLTAISIGMILANQPDDGKFGDLPALANGMYFGYESPTFLQHIAAVKDNSELRLYCGPANVEYTTRSGGTGSYGLSAMREISGQQNYGVAIRLSTSTDRFYVSIHDNLTSIIQFRMKARGHLVVD